MHPRRFSGAFPSVFVDGWGGPLAGEEAEGGGPGPGGHGLDGAAARHCEREGEECFRVLMSSWIVASGCEDLRTAELVTSSIRAPIKEAFYV